MVYNRNKNRGTSFVLALLVLAGFMFFSCKLEPSSEQVDDDTHSEDNGSDHNSDNNAQTYDLTITKTGSGAGKVIIDSAAIDCGADCINSFDQGTLVTLSAAAEEGAYFGGWTGGGCSGTGQCVISMDGPKDITATFNVIGSASSITQRDITWYFDKEYQ
jgi:hypothetical protein